MKLFRVTTGLRLLRERSCYLGERDDVFIVSYPKSGTTWMQMIVYQLLTDGDMSFRHIDDISPHLEDTMAMFDQKLADLKRPRVIKSHLPIRDIPKGPGRYIYVVRDGRDVAVSLWHWFQDESPDFATFFKQFVDGSVSHGSWFKHAETWISNRPNLNLYVVRYEDLKIDLAATIRGVATFLDVHIDERDFPRIMEHCSFEGMRLHETKFNLQGRLPTPPVMIRAGKVGSWRENVAEEDLASYYAAFDRDVALPALQQYRA